MAKVTVTINYPIEEGVQGFHDIELTKRIRVKQLMTVLRKQLNLNHMDDPHVCIMRNDHPVYFPENSKQMLLLKDDEEIHLVCDNCRVTTDEGMRHLKDQDLDLAQDQEDEACGPRGSVKEFKFNQYKINYIDDGTVVHEEIHKIMDGIIATFKEKYHHIDLSKLSDEDKINTLTDQHIFYHNMLQRITNRSESKQIVIHNLIIQLALQARNTAKMYGLETAMSKKITEYPNDPFNKVLRDNGKHRFQYEDEINKAQEMHSKVIYQDPEFHYFISPRNLIGNYHHRTLLKLLIEMIKNNPNKFGGDQRNAQSTIEYSTYINKTFPEKYCKDYEKMNDLLIKGTIVYDKHPPYYY